MRCPGCAPRSIPGRWLWPTPSGWPTRPSAPTPEAVDSASDLLEMAKDLPPDQFAREASAWTQRHQPDHGHQRLAGKAPPPVPEDPETTRRHGPPRRAARPRDRHPHLQPPPRHRRTTPPPRPENSPRQRRGLRLRRFRTARKPGLGISSGPTPWTCSPPTTPKGHKVGGGAGGRPKAEIIAVADIGVLTGDNPAGRCEIPGTGPVPPEVLQRIACDAQLTGVIFADGKPLYHGSTDPHRHRPPNGGCSSPATAAASAAVLDPRSARPITSCPTPGCGEPTSTI